MRGRRLHDRLLDKMKCGVVDKLRRSLDKLKMCRVVDMLKLRRLLDKLKVCRVVDTLKLRRLLDKLKRRLLDKLQCRSCVLDTLKLRRLLDKLKCRSCVLDTLKLRRLLDKLKTRLLDKLTAELPTGNGNSPTLQASSQ